MYPLISTGRVEGKRK